MFTVTPEIMAEVIKEDTSAKVKKALELFFQVDGDMQNVCLHGIGFKGPLALTELRDHFDTMDLMDTIDSAIEDLQYDLDNNQ